MKQLNCQVIEMDPVSSTTTIRVAPENFQAHSKTVWENVMTSLNVVLEKAAITNVQPLGQIGNSGLNVDVYA